MAIVVMLRQLLDVDFENARRRFAFPSVALVLLLVMPASYVARSTASDPFSLLYPYIRLTREERVRIAKGQSLVKILPGDGRELNFTLYAAAG